MNSNNQRTVQNLLDPEWHTTIAQQLVIYPMPELVIEPSCLGQYMAEIGQPCEPRKWYTSPSDIEAFIVAYDDTTALWAEMVEAAQDDGKVDFEAELIDLLDGIDDNEFWRKGQY
jgi:hypothetical protein